MLQRGRNQANRIRGAVFERVFEATALREGLLPLRNGQAVRYLPGGRMLAVKSQLDWTLLGHEGLIALLDTKSFGERFFTYSQIEPHQLARAEGYARQGFVAGFCVHFRLSERVAFFEAMDIVRRGPRTRFGEDEGVPLGDARLTLSLRRLWPDGRRCRGEEGETQARRGLRAPV